MNVKTILFVLILCLYQTFGFCQKLASIDEQAQYYFEIKDYEKAYDLFDQLLTKSPKSIDYKFKLGMCSMFHPEKKSRAIEIFTDLKQLAKGPERLYYLGRAYHTNYEFDKAIAEFEEFIRTNKNSTKEEKRLNKEAEQYIVNCKAAKILLENKVVADFKNLGSPVNTEGDEYVPSITADESIMLFTYRGKNSMGGKLNEQLKPDEQEGDYHEDVYITTMNSDSTWAQPVSVLAVNTNGNDAAISVSQDGRYMFMFQSDENNSGDIYMSVLTGTNFSKPEPLNDNINSDAWEGSCSISADSKVLYFASERPGGYGGRDIWASVKVNNDWGPPVNLGPKINTSLDEDAPFIHPDGITLIFSSKGHLSIGGYDIMFSIMKENEWTTPKSMGIPLNTTDDDRYYVINSKGDRGYFSSNRAGAGGKGKQDIYTVQPGILGEKPVVALLKGVIFGNDKPIEANIEVLKNSENKLIGPYISNDVTGRYLLAISPGSTYRIKVYADGYSPIVEDLDVEKLDKYLEIKKDFYLYTTESPISDTAKAVATSPVTNSSSVAVNQANVANPTVVTTNNAKETPSVSTTNNAKETPSVVTTNNAKETPSVATTNNAKETPSVATTNNAKETPSVATTNNAKETPTIVNTSAPCAAMPLPDFTPLKGKTLNDPANYKLLMNMAGNYCAQGLVFKVQIGAYRNPQNFKYKNLIDFGKPEVSDYPDGITRFTQQQFTTLNDAEKLRQKAISKGQKDAWIVAFVNGKRYTVEELIMLDFLGKSIN